MKRKKRSDGNSNYKHRKGNSNLEGFIKKEKKKDEVEKLQEQGKTPPE